MRETTTNLGKNHMSYLHLISFKSQSTIQIGNLTSHLAIFHFLFSFFLNKFIYLEALQISTHLIFTH